MRRALPAFSCPLQHRRWRALQFDGLHWHLLPQQESTDAQPLSRIDVVLDLGEALWLRLRWASRWRWWPQECHLWLCAGTHAVDWPLLRTALAGGRRWLGDGPDTPGDAP